jgi:hypothetical protein
VAKSPTSDRDRPVTPKEFPITTPTTSMADHSFTLQAVMEMQKCLGSLESKIDRAVNDISSHGKKLDELNEKFVFVRGFGVAALVLIPICGMIIWWLIGDKLNDIRNEILRSRASQTISIPK